MFGLANTPIPGDGNGAEYLYQHKTSTNVYDVTVSNNCTADTKTNCTAHAGFDTPTGFGAPRGLSLFGGPDIAGGGGGGKTGDLNNDGKVNVQDLAQLLIAFGKTGANTADLNKDAKVNVQDLALLLINFGK